MTAKLYRLMESTLRDGDGKPIFEDGSDMIFLTLGLPEEDTRPPEPRPASRPTDLRPIPTDPHAPFHRWWAPIEARVRAGWTEALASEALAAHPEGVHLTVIVPIPERLLAEPDYDVLEETLSELREALGVTLVNAGIWPQSVVPYRAHWPWDDLTSTAPEAVLA